MGGDGAPQSNIEGCLVALRKGARILAFGSEQAVFTLRAKGDFEGLSTTVCRETVSADEPGLQAIRDKQDSTITRGILAVKEGAAGAFVSGGSTGALVAGGVLLLGRAKGVDKPCLAMVLPSKGGRGVLFLDLGASADARPQTLVQFAVMGDIYARDALGWVRPGVYLLNIGIEPEKGSVAARKAYSLLKEAPVSFRGNIEARDVFSGKADVIVTDGFTGNVFLKTCEGTAAFQMDALRAELGAGPLRKAAALALRPAFRKVKELLDYSSYGGAPLLGLEGCVVKCHGSSGPMAIANGIEQARRFLLKDVAGVISRTLSEMSTEGE
jgi:glycerol-3-phosphate acyltransferase PlsX